MSDDALTTPAHRATPQGPLTKAEAAGIAALLARGYVPVQAGDVAASASILHDLCRAPKLVERLRHQLELLPKRETKKEAA